MKNSIRNLIFILCNLILILVERFLLVRPEVSDLNLYIAWMLIDIGLFIILRPEFGGILTIIFNFILFKNVSGKINFIIIISILTFAIVIYKNNKRKKQLQLSALALFLFFGAYLLTDNYQKNILSEDDGFGIDLINTDYYYYNHLKNKDDYILKFGKLSYFERTVEDSLDLIIHKKEVLTDVNKYINRRKTINSNEMTGVLKDKNILIIQSTFLHNAYISAELTPNICRMINNGIYFQHFNNLLTNYDVNSVEIMTNLSLFPTGTDGCESYLYDNAYYADSLANMFKRNGYNTTMYVNDYDVFYNRKNMFEVYGYDRLRTSYHVGKDGNILSSELIDEILYNLVTAKEKEMIFYTATDCAEINENIADGIKNVYGEISDKDIAKISNLMDLDNSIGILINELERNGRLEDTVIMFYGVDENRSLSHASLSNSRGVVDCTSMILFGGKLEPNIDIKRISSLDIFPTLANMYDFEYNYKYLVGEDAYDEEFFGAQLTSFYKDSYNWYDDNDRYNFWDFRTEYFDEKHIAIAGAKSLKDKYRFSYYWFKYNDIIVDQFNLK